MLLLLGADQMEFKGAVLSRGAELRQHREEYPVLRNVPRLVKTPGCQLQFVLTSRQK